MAVVVAGHIAGVVETSTLCSTRREGEQGGVPVAVPITLGTCDTSTPWHPFDGWAALQPLSHPTPLCLPLSLPRPRFT